MSKLPMDLSKFRKVKSDAHTSTFQHYAGHEITIAHNKLSGKMRADLDKIPVSKKKVQKFDDGGEVDSSSAQDTPEQIVSDAAAQAPISDQAQSSQASPTPTDGYLQGAANLPQPPQNPDQFGLLGSNQAQQDALKRQQAAEMGLAGAEGARGTAQASVEQTYQKQAQQQNEDYKTAIQPFIDQNNALTNDLMNGHVDPKRYVDNMSTGGKISTAIGLILGGIGSGLTHGPNLAFQYLQNQIDRDIDSQKQDLGKKNNLLSHNIQMMGNVRAGEEMTRAQQYKIVQSQLAAEADKAQSPIAKQNSAIINSQLAGKIADINRQGAIYKMQQGNAGSPGGDPAKLVPLLVPGEHQKQAFSEIEAAENTRKMSSSILQSFEDAAKANTVMRTGAGHLRIPAEVGALHQSMQPTFKDLEGTVRQAAMDNTFKNITPAPGDLDSTIDTKRQALKDYLQSKLSAPTARAYGIDLGHYGRTAPLAGQGQVQKPAGNFGFKPRNPNGG